MLGVDKIIKSDIGFSNIRAKNGVVVLNIPGENFNGKTFENFVKDISYIVKKYKNNDSILLLIKMGEKFFKDKAAYILTESVIFYLLKETKLKVKIEIDKIFIKIKEHKFEIKNTLLCKYKNCIIDANEYINDFYNPYNDYRRIISNNSEIPKLYSDLIYRFEALSMDEEIKDKLIDMIIELVGNAIGHSKKDCLLDISVKEIVRKEDMHKFYEIDLVILNFSDILLGDGIKKKINYILEGGEKISFLNNLENAYNNHNKHFNYNYCLDDFCNVSTFQWRFSGRDELIDDNGGTGLTQLIESLLKATEVSDCYVYSGDKIIHFHHQFLKIDDQKFVGFNNEGDYLNKIPDKSTIARSKYFLSGTLYNFQMIIEKI